MRKPTRMLSLLLALVLCAVLLAACGGGAASSSSTAESIPAPPATSAAEPPPVSSGSNAQSWSEPATAPEPEPATSEAPSSKPAQPAPTFNDGTPVVVSMEGRRVTVSYKTDVESTVNAILSIRGDRISTNTFYDYTRRGIALEGAVSHKSTYKVGPAGVTETFELPDLTLPYYLIVNAVENETGTWQSTTTLLLLYDPGTAAPTFSAKPVQQADTDTEYVWLFETNATVRVWVMILAADAKAPTAVEIRDKSYTASTIYGYFTLDPAGANAPFSAQLKIPKNTLGAGNYSIWYMAQKAGDTNAPISIADYVLFTVK